jgi:hypothetical protein
MSAFGFDPSIILSGKPATLSDMLAPAREYEALQTQRATLAALAQKQQQEQALRGVYAANANAPENLPRALLGIGAGQEAMGWQDQTSQMANAEAQRRKMASDLMEAAKQHVRNQVAAVQNADQYNQFIAGTDPRHLTAMGLPTEYDPAKLKMFVAGGIPAEKQAELDQKDRALGLRVVNTGTGQRMALNPETGQYDIPVGKPKPAGGGGSAGGSGGLDPDVVDREAAAYNITHTLPSLGMGKDATAAKRAIMKRAAELAKASGDDAGLASNAASYKSDSASLRKLQTQADSVQAFEDTALKNLDTALGAAAKVPDAGGSLLNTPIRAWADRMGNTDMSAYKAALTTARTEIGKVLSGATGNAAVSEGARHEVEALLGDNASLAQLKAAADILKKDMTNRKEAVAESIGAIHGRLGGKKNEARGGKPPPNGHATVVQNGHTFTWNPQTGEYE